MTGQHPSPLSILPHSYPFLMIDRIMEREKGKQIVCLKNVTINEEFFQGHFRENPVMPGALIIEAMAQASGLIIGDENTKAYLSRVNNARFRRTVVPGDRLIIKSNLIQTFHPLYVFEAAAYVEGKIASEAEITLTII